jgi:PAS domain S-box-containing protein
MLVTERREALEPSAAVLQKLVHELRVHQTELEVQNEELRRAQLDLQASRDRSVDLWQSSPVAYAEMDRRGVILEVNAAMGRLTGLGVKQLVGRSLIELVVPDDQRRFLEHLRLYARRIPHRQTRPPFEVGLSRPDGTVRIVELRCTVSVSGCRATLVEITEWKRAERALRESEHELRKSREELEQLARRYLKVQEEERRRIAIDLHDDVNQRLGAIELRMEVLCDRVGALSPPLAAELNELRARMAEIEGAIHGAAQRLHPSAVDHLGLAAATEAHVQEFGRQHGIVAHVRHHRITGCLSPDAELCLYRVTQEALRNVAQHARAKEVTVTLERTPRGVGLCVADTGCGFDPEAARDRGGLGLISMAERVRALGGKFSVRSRPGHGTHVHASLPGPRRRR